MRLPFRRPAGDGDPADTSSTPTVTPPVGPSSTPTVTPPVGPSRAQRRAGGPVVGFRHSADPRRRVRNADKMGTRAWRRSIVGHRLNRPISEREYQALANKVGGLG